MNTENEMDHLIRNCRHNDRCKWLDQARKKERKREKTETKKRKQQYGVVLIWLGLVGSIGAFCDGQAGRAWHRCMAWCMGRCMGAWQGGFALGVLSSYFGLPEPVTSLWGGCYMKRIFYHTEDVFFVILCYKVS